MGRGNMKRYIIFSIFFGLVSAGVFAQDDMYFNPKKDTDKKAYQPTVQTERYEYNSALRDVDEYNRMGNFESQYTVLSDDSLDSDVIELYPDSVYALMSDSLVEYDDVYYDEAYNPDEDFSCSRRMSRFDDFYWCDPWYCGWYGPYYYSRYWWCDPWYDPWFYGWYGWYSPWGWGGWYYPSYWYGGGIAFRGYHGTRNHGRLIAGMGGHNFSGRRTAGTTGASSVRRYSGVNGRTSSSFNGSRASSSYNGNRQSSSYSRQNTRTTPTYNNNSFGGSRSSFGGSFGGSRGGSFGGGFGGGGSRG
ncbi:MAG: hypothetical protein LUC88_08555, partial [Prevotella sp.]|nr:hypothetical protein [Prevotella sp.]